VDRLWLAGQSGSLQLRPLATFPCPFLATSTIRVKGQQLPALPVFETTCQVAGLSSTNILQHHPFYVVECTPGAPCRSSLFGFDCRNLLVPFLFREVLSKSPCISVQPSRSIFLPFTPRNSCPSFFIPLLLLSFRSRIVILRAFPPFWEWR